MLVCCKLHYDAVYCNSMYALYSSWLIYITVFTQKLLLKYKLCKKKLIGLLLDSQMHYQIVFFKGSLFAAVFFFFCTLIFFYK